MKLEDGSVLRWKERVIPLVLDLLKRASSDDSVLQEDEEVTKEGQVKCLATRGSYKLHVTKDTKLDPGCVQCFTGAYGTVQKFFPFRARMISPGSIILDRPLPRDVLEGELIPTFRCWFLLG